MRRIWRLLSLVAVFCFVVLLLYTMESTAPRLVLGIASLLFYSRILLKFYRKPTADWSVENVKEPIGFSGGSEHFGEMFLRYKRLETRSATYTGLPTHFLYEYYQTVFEVMLLQSSASSRLLLVVQAHCQNPGSFLLCDNEEIRNAVKKHITIPSQDDRKGRDLLLSTPAIRRQLQRLNPTQFVLLNRTRSVAATWIDWPEYTSDLITRYTSALYDLHVYAKRSMNAKHITVEAASENALCPFCKGEIGSADINKCENCSAVHHSECWQENSGCAIFGCSSTTAGSQPESLTE